MVEPNLPFDRDRFVRDLPELLSGRDPILDRPIARRWMRESPEGRRAVQDIVGAVAVLEDAPTRIIRASVLDARAARSIELAAKWFPGALSRTLREIMNLELIERSTESDHLIVQAKGEILDPGVSMSAIVERLQRLTRSSISERSCVDRTLLSDLRRNTVSFDPAHCLAAIRSLDPTPHDDYAEQLLRVWEHGEDRRPELRQLARTTASLDVAARAAILSCDLDGENSELNEAVDAALWGMRFEPTAILAAYNGLMYALLASRLADAKLFLHTLDIGLSCDPTLTLQLAFQFMRDGKRWLNGTRSNPQYLIQLMRLFGRAT